MAIGTLALAIPLVLMMVFLVQKGWGLLSVHLFYKDLKGVGPLSPAGVRWARHGDRRHPRAGGPGNRLGGSGRDHHGHLLERGGRPVHLDGEDGRHRDGGLPSIMAGVFIYSIWIVTFGQGFSGLAGSLAIAIMLLPSITRTTEEVLKVVSGGLREAALALGAPEWRTVWSVVLPTARTGIITAVVLGVARAVGETAPLLFTIFGNNFVNANPFHGPAVLADAVSVPEGQELEPGRGEPRLHSRARPRDDRPGPLHDHTDPRSDKSGAANRLIARQRRWCKVELANEVALPEECWTLPVRTGR